MTEPKTTERKLCHIDPMWIEPQVKQQVSSTGVWVYVDTCDHCGNYSDHYHACKIRDTNNRTEINKQTKTPMSVPRGHKCKYWVKSVGDSEE
jgi:hypothetical protein